MEQVASSLSTREFAQALRVDPNTIRRGLCVSGHYLHIVPVKLPNNRLLWPADQVLGLLKQNGEG